MNDSLCPNHWNPDPDAALAQKRTAHDCARAAQLGQHLIASRVYHRHLAHIRTLRAAGVDPHCPPVEDLSGHRVLPVRVQVRRRTWTRRDDLVVAVLTVGLIAVVLWSILANH